MATNLFRNVFNALAGKPLDDDYYYLYLHDQAEQRAKAAYSSEALSYLKALKPYSGYPIPDFESREDEQSGIWIVTEKTLGQLEDFAREHRISLQNLFTAAGAAALGKYNHARQVGVRWTYNGRDEAWKERLMGMYLENFNGALTLFEFIIFEQGEDRPLRIEAVYNCNRYRKESAETFAKMFAREIDCGCQMS